MGKQMKSDTGLTGEAIEEIEDRLDMAEALEAKREAEKEGTIPLEELLEKYGTKV